MEIKLPPNCRIVRQDPQLMRPEWGEINEDTFHDAHGLNTLVGEVLDFPRDQWLVLEYPKGTDPHAVVRRMQALKGHLWDVVLWDRPQALLIRGGPLKYRQLWVDGVKPMVGTMFDIDTDWDLYRLLLVGFWSMAGPERMANMRLEGMEQAEKKEGEGLLWGSWSDFVDPKKEM